jgi:hypothetical protein
VSKTDFATFVMDLSHGDVNGMLSEKLEQLIGAVHETGKAGSLTIKLAIKKEGTMAVAHADTSLKLPEPAMPGTMFFFDEEGKSLTREDPRQLSLKSLVQPSIPLRTVNSDDNE